MTDDSKKYTIPCPEVVLCVEFSPYEASCQLLAVSTSTRVTVFSCRFEEEDADVDGIEYTQIRDFQTENQTSTIAWNPETSLSVLPKFLSFATAELDVKDHHLRLFTSNLKEDESVLRGTRHTAIL
ncbi:nucleoporin Nup37-like [Gigantopelta aegis]|uniref:nucleoporin Nup37-like n=1 Tax=Gigantopelta aegis TaxID=1735272 RepID=UPI001B88C9A2|nr:nucleoporin Nup37-like [Gigantopelta aegis]